MRDFRPNNQVMIINLENAAEICSDGPVVLRNGDNVYHQDEYHHQEWLDCLNILNFMNQA